MTLADYPVRAPALRPPVVFDQFWGDIAFVHWPVRTADVVSLFPPGSRPDVFADGLTYVGLIPFQMRDAALGRTHAVPYFGRFHETNVRLYSTDDAGHHGVLFRSLETQRLAVVPAARIAFGVPYTWARMRTTRSGDRIRYESVRRWPRRGLRSTLEVRIGAEIDASDLDVWLTARWGAHTRVAGRTWWVPNEHASWPLRAAEILELDDDLLGASGVRVAGAPVPVRFSPGVRTRFGRPTRIA